LSIFAVTLNAEHKQHGPAIAAPRWYAVQTRSNFERRVTGELAARGLETFYPTIREVHRWKDRRKEVDVPIFPGYLFTRIVDNPSIRLQVLRTAGAVRILGYGAEIEPVPDIEIESIRKLLESRARFYAHPFLREGAWVRVRRGALEGVEGRLIRMKAGARLVLSVEMLSKAVATEIDSCDIEVARPPGC
jgi:transcription antitermination factor NusG